MRSLHMTVLHAMDDAEHLHLAVLPEGEVPS